MNSLATVSLYKVSESNNTTTLTLTACALAAKTTLPLQHQEGQIWKEISGHRNNT